MYIPNKNNNIIQYVNALIFVYNIQFKYFSFNY